MNLGAKITMTKTQNKGANTTPLKMIRTLTSQRAVIISEELEIYPTVIDSNMPWTIQLAQKVTIVNYYRKP